MAETFFEHFEKSNKFYNNLIAVMWDVEKDSYSLIKYTLIVNTEVVTLTFIIFHAVLLEV